MHETGHALLGHANYQADYELIQLEVAAWQEAKQIAKPLKIEIDEDHIQDCLDTYRDWLYKRSICPNCATKSLQQGDFVHYRCFNCHTTWRVSNSLFQEFVKILIKRPFPRIFLRLQFSAQQPKCLESNKLLR